MEIGTKKKNSNISIINSAVTFLDFQKLNPGSKIIGITVELNEILTMGSETKAHPHSAGIISETGVQQWTVPVNTLPYLTLLQYARYYS